MAMVPHEVPVANEITAAMTNTASGSNARGIRSERALERNEAVPTAVVTSPKDHARTRMMIASTIARMPPTNAEMVRESVRMRWVTARTTATTHPTRDPHNSVLKGSAFPRIRDIVRGSSGSSPCNPV
jgi:hypothetical protein